MGRHRILTAVINCSFGLLAAAGIAAAQDSQQQDQAPHAWRTASDAQAEQGPQEPVSQQPNWIAQQGSPDQGPPPPPNFSANQQGGPSAMQTQGQQPQSQQGSYAAPRQQPQRPTVPAQLTIRPGTFVSIRMNQGLSSDHNQQGDTFFATLAQPLVVDGVIVAQRGETVMGRVSEAQKAGRVEGTSRLGVELTGITLADGQQLSIQSQMVGRNGDTSVGRDVGAVAGTTALGAAIGAGADWGRGAAIGAGAGAAAGLLGVLLTRGHPTVIYPESVLTFRISAPAIVATDRAPYAFRYVEGQDYSRNTYAQGPARPVGPTPYGAAPYAPAPYYGYGSVYGPGYYPNYYGPTAAFYFGPSWYGYRGGFYFRGRR